MKKLYEAGRTGGYFEVSQERAYYPQGDTAEAVARLLVYLRANHGMTHAQAVEVCGNYGVEEEEDWMK